VTTSPAQPEAADATVSPAPALPPPAAPPRSAKYYLRLAVQAVVSVALLAVLGWLAVRYDVTTSLRVIDAGDVALATAALVIACLINSLRWRLLLNNAGVVRPLHDLAGLYFIGMFFSTFLPTGTGGDVFRIYDVAKKSGKLAATVVATLQERLLGLGVSMLIGLGASIYYFDRLPPALRPWVLAAQIAGPLGVAVALYPMTFLKPFAALWRRAPQGLVRHGLVAKVSAMIASLTAVSPLTLARLLNVLLVSAAGIVMTISVYWLLGRSLNVGVSLGGFLLVVPLVWVIKMVPVSLGGIGVGEVTIVFLLREIFAADTSAATAVAVAYLALQLCVALLGGIVLAIRVMRFGGNAPQPPTTAPAPSPAAGGT
jgi:uncharacterized protein (TIRG00374 family)